MIRLRGRVDVHQHELEALPIRERILHAGDGVGAVSRAEDREPRARHA